MQISPPDPNSSRVERTAAEQVELDQALPPNSGKPSYPNEVRRISWTGWGAAGGVGLLIWAALLYAAGVL